jgi:tetratricopeptide (TPR) repeat protein
MICCLNPNCLQENPPCPDGTKYCFTCGTELVLLSDRYRPIRRLGQGGFGITYLAEDKARFDKSCVIKQLTLQIPDARRLFEGEAQRLEDLADCPVIPRLLAYHSDADYLYLVQEFVAGQDLDKELREKGVFDEAALKKFLNELLPVLDLIHQRGIIHRDIKLENIMRGLDGKLVLIDFGIAKLIPANNTPKPGTRAGTDGYAAPEQVKEGLAKPSSDLYSLGAACFHLLTNINPGSLFLEYGYQWTGKWQQQVRQPISKDLKELIDKLLKSEDVDRYQSAGEVLQVLNSQPPEKPASTVSSAPKKDVSFYMATLGMIVGASTVLWMLAIGSSLFSSISNVTKVPQTAEDYFERAYKLDDSNRQGAIEDYTQAIKLKPDFSEAYNNRGLRREESEDYKGAIKDYTEAIRINSNYPEAYNNRGDSRSALGDYKNAIEDYNQAIKIKPDVAMYYYNRGEARYKSEDYKGAIEDYDQAIKLQSDYANPYNGRGNSHSALGDNKGAIEDYNQAIKIQPDDAIFYSNRGLSKYKLDDYKSAIEDYNQAIKIKPDAAIYYYNRGLSKYKLEDYKGAIEDYNQAINLQSDNASFYNDRGNSHLALGDNKEAFKDYNQAIKIQPDYALFHFNRGLSHHQSGDYKSAVEDYSQAIKLQSDDADFYNNRGNSHSALGDNKEAIEDYNQAIKIRPNDEVIYSNRGQSQGQLGNHKIAIEDYTRAIKIKPDYAISYDKRCFSHNELGNYQVAIKDCNQSIKLNSDNAITYHNRGFSRSGLGDKQGAIEDYNKAIELYQKQGKNQDTDENYRNTLKLLAELQK